MGVKRSFEEEDVTELSLKQSKQLDHGKNLTLYEEDFLSAITSPQTDFPGELKSDFYKFRSSRRIENAHTNSSPMADKELETTAPPSWVTSSSSSEEDAGMEDATFGSYFPGYFDFSIPRQLPEQFENPYSLKWNCSPRKEFPVGPDRQAELLPRGCDRESDCLGHNFIVDNYREQKPMGSCIVPMPDNSIIESSLLNCSPRKEIPVGPNHQAEVLPWGMIVTGKDCIDSSFTDDHYREQRLMGTCVNPMPDDSTIDGVRVRHGRTDCSCLDVGSMKCVDQHVKEAREKLRETIGDEKFMELGFYDMGEEVAWKWAADDDHLYQEIIFSNPASLGRNFWKHLSVAFPTRTKKEIVSYYFNVFMLRRRAIQNRSHLLDIDSDDDDEWRGTHGDFYQNRSNLLDSDMDDEDDDSDDEDEQQQGACENFYQDRSHILYSDVDDNDYEQLVAHGDFYHVARENEDSTVESLGYQDLPVGCGDNSSPDCENVSEDKERNHRDRTFHGNDNVNK